MPGKREGASHQSLRVSSDALDMIPLGVILTGPDQIITYANKAFLAITGYPEAEVIGRHCGFLQGPLTDPDTVKSIGRAIAEGSEFRGEILNYRRDGCAFWNEISIAPVLGEQAEISYFIGTAQDVSKRVHTEQAVRESEQRLQLALLGGSLGLWDWRVSDGQLTVNDRWLTMLGMDPDGPRPTIALWSSLVHPEDLAKLDRIVEDVIRNPEGREFEVEVRARCSDGRTVWILDKGAVVERADDGTPIRVSGTHLDITERKQAEEKTHSLAYYDTLTGLPNRRLLLDHAGLALAAARRSLQKGAFLFVDLDDFKHINDARGHPTGDVLLQQIAHRLSALMRAGNTVARLGGDEFVVLVNELGADMESSARAAHVVAERVFEALAAPFAIDGVSYSVKCSIGITLFPKPGDEVEDLLREADTAMYQAKKGGPNRVVFFHSAMHTEVERRLAIEHALKEAVGRQQLDLYAQSKVNQFGKVTGCELLLRWTHPRYGSVPPTQFIPIAEASCQIHLLGDWIIEQACKSLVALRKAGCQHTLSVNVSPRQFRHDSFVDNVRNIIKRTGAAPSGLIFEVTEGLLIENWEATAARMAELTELGIRFSIDDFGTGYSSLAYLKRLPIDEIKIDRCFVQGIPENASDEALVEAILSVAGHLGLHVVAEGIESQAQFDFLVKRHCECLQGYLFHRPVPLQQWMASCVPAESMARLT